jgi:nucleoid-associated protein YgaU
VQDATAEAPAPVAVADAPKEEQPAPVTVLRASEAGVEVVQSAASAQVQRGKIVLDTISYSDEGDVELAGRAQSEAVVRVYVNNNLITDFNAGEDGRWQGRLPHLDPGVYTLRLDELDSAGKVLSRLETPFKREAPEVLQPAPQPEESPAQPAPLVRAVTVQEGDTLWAISRDRYGSGVLYVRVFEANRNAIRDPDLIYPGQVFTIPE